MQSLASRGAPSLRAVRAPLPITKLPDTVSAMTVASVGRQAFIAFLQGVGGAWEKKDIAAWLRGPYAELTSYTAGLLETEDQDSSTFVRIRNVNAKKLDDVLRAAKEEVLATLLMAAPPDSDVRFADRAIAAGHVSRTRDKNGRGGWAPIDAPGMLLHERVLSLVSVDYLMRPSDYLALLSVCGVCQAVSFDAQMRVRGHCIVHRKSSRKIAVSR